MEDVTIIEELNKEIEYPIVNTDEMDYCKLSVSYEGDPEVVKDKIDEAVAQLRKVQIPGFRAGKAPDYAIRLRCKKRIDEWVIREMAAQAYDDMVFETGVKPIGNPEFKNFECKNTKFKCDMVVYHKPEFELADYEGIEVQPFTRVAALDEQVQNSIEALRLRAGEVLPYGENDVVSKGDSITMSFNATIDGKEFEGSTAEGELYTVGSGKFPDFDDYILGMKAGDEREFELVLPEDYPEIGGKTAKFKVTVHMGTTRKPAEINQNFFETCGVKDFEDLKNKLKQIVDVQNKQEENEFLRRQVTEKLVEIHDFKVPEFLVNKEAQFIALKSGFEFSKTTKDIQEKIMDIAEKNCKLSLILDSIREDEPDAVLNDGEAKQSLVSQFQMQGKDPGKSLVEAQRNGSLHGMISALRDEFALQWVVNKTKVKTNGETESSETNNT